MDATERIPGRASPDRELPTLDDFIRREGEARRESLARELFKYLDYDGDGALEVYELRRALQLLRTRAGRRVTIISKQWLSRA